MQHFGSTFGLGDSLVNALLSSLATANFLAVFLYIPSDEGYWYPLKREIRTKTRINHNQMIACKHIEKRV